MVPLRPLTSRGNWIADSVDMMLPPAGPLIENEKLQAQCTCYSEGFVCGGLRVCWVGQGVPANALLMVVLLQTENGPYYARCGINAVDGNGERPEMMLVFVTSRSDRSEGDQVHTYTLVSARTSLSRQTTQTVHAGPDRVGYLLYSLSLCSHIRTYK